jgi:ankyrin repeat protein
MFSLAVMHDQDGKTALHHAVEKGFDDIITLLLDRGANVDIASVVSESCCVHDRQQIRGTCDGKGWDMKRCDTIG